MRSEEIKALSSSLLTPHSSLLTPGSSLLTPCRGCPVPVVTCPNCPTKLKVPDGAKGNVKCPKCGTAFPAGGAPKPAAASGFEVVDEAPPPKPAAGSKAAAPLPKAGTKPAKAVAAEAADDFEVIDEEKPKKKPVAAVAAEADDDDDEPEKKKKKDDEDDEDDAKAKKKKKKREEYDSPEEVPTGDKGGFGFAETGAMLIVLSLWLYVGTFVYLALMLALAWAGVGIPNIMMVVAGFLGLGNWTLGLIGCAYCLVGPSRARGRAAAAFAVAMLHLVLTFGAGARGVQSAIPLLSSTAKAESIAADAKRLTEKLMKETDPAKKKDIEKELRELGGGFDEERPGRTGGGFAGDPFWQHSASQNLNADHFLANLCYESRGFTRYLVGFLSGLFEVLRVVFLILLLSAVARASRDSGVANKSMIGILSVLGATLLSMIVMLIIAAILDDSKSSAKTTPTTPDEAKAAVKKLTNTLAGGELLVYLLHAGGLVMAAVMAMGAKTAAGRRS